MSDENWMDDEEHAAPAEAEGGATLPLGEPIDPERLDAVDEVWVELRRPVQVSGEARKWLRIREPNMDQLGRARKAKNDLAMTARLLCDCADLTPEAVKHIGTRDAARVSEVLNHFLGLSQA